MINRRKAKSEGFAFLVKGMAKTVLLAGYCLYNKNVS